jgi:16S rRNA (cytosine967-C5)-methyltransferase
VRQSSLYGHTEELLGLVLASRQPADAVVRDFYRSRHYLGARDRRFISDLLFDILRHFFLLDRACTRALADVRPLGLPGKIPPAAYVIAHQVKVAGVAAEALLGDVSGLWRTVTTEIEPALLLQALASVELPSPDMTDPAERLSLEHSIPPEIVREWLQVFGESEALSLCRASNGIPPTTIRVNTLRCSVGDCAAALEKEGVPVRAATLSPAALHLEKRVNLPSLRAYQEGLCEPQDEGSQLIGYLVGARPGDKVVDACAGGGGKTLHLAALMGNEGSILALDTEERRLKNLFPRLRRSGATIVRGSLVGQAAPALEDLRGGADAVLIDAPCSGAGTFRRNPGAKRTFSAASSGRFQEIQTRLLRDYAALVRPGGRLVYSTCTLLRAENEDVVDAFLASSGEFSLLSAPDLLREAGIPLAQSGKTMLLLPHRTGTDGFFAAAMVRRG